jgi:predicted TIM-barrel fold metal-dependent hydrolase
MGSGASIEETKTNLQQAKETWEKGSATHQAWLDQTPEKALEPELEIIDTHHHLWDMRMLNGYNLFGLFKQQYYLTDELVNDCIGGGHNITKTVYMEAHAFQSKDVEAVMAPLGEVQFVQGIAAQFASGTYGPFRGAAGIIGTADLAKFGSEVEPLLVACKAIPNYRGIRVPGQYDPNTEFGVGKAGLYGEAKFREGFALLEKHGLIFDAFVYSPQLPDIVDLAKAFPGIIIVLNHVGGPLAGLGNYPGAKAYDGKQEEILAKWKEEMTKVAKECPNVNVKLGGLGMPHFGSGFDAQDKPPTSEEVAKVIKDYILFTIEVFGASRCMFEGNFPVDRSSMSYSVLWNAFKRLTKDAGLSDADRALLFSGTAKRVYKL